MLPWNNNFDADDGGGDDVDSSDDAHDIADDDIDSGFDYGRARDEVGAADDIGAGAGVDGGVNDSDNVDSTGGAGDDADDTAGSSANITEKTPRFWFFGTSYPLITAMLVIVVRLLSLEVWRNGAFADIWRLII